MKNKKNRFISDKISQLKDEGKSYEQSLAIALSMANNMFQQGGYKIGTDLDGYGLNTKPIVLGDLNNIEQYQKYTGKGYGNQLQDVNKTIDTHSWYFSDEDKKRRFLEASSKRGGSQEIKDFQEAYNKELQKRLNESNLNEQEKNKIYNESAFTGKGVQLIDGKFGAFTSSRPMFETVQQTLPPQSQVPALLETPPIENQPINKSKLYKVNIIAEDMSDETRDFQKGSLQGYINNKMEKQGGLTEEDLEYVRKGIDMNNRDIEAKYNNSGVKKSKKAQERFKKLQQRLEVEEFEYGGEYLPKYEVGGTDPKYTNTKTFTYNPKTGKYEYNSVKKPQSSTPGNELWANPFAPNNAPSLGSQQAQPTWTPSQIFQPSNLSFNNQNKGTFNFPTYKQTGVKLDPNDKAVWDRAFKAQNQPDETNIIQLDEDWYDEQKRAEEKPFFDNLKANNAKKEQELQDILQEKREKDVTTTFTQQDPIQFFNPYGGVDLNSAASIFGQSLQSGDTLSGVASGLKLATGLGRNFMGGFAAGKAREEAIADYEKNRRNAMTGAKNPTAMGQDGGVFYAQEGGEKETYYATLLQENPDIDLSHPSLKNLTIKGEHFDKNLGRNVPNMQTPIEYRFSIENQSSYGDGSSDLAEYTFMPERDYRVLTEPYYKDLYENKSEYSSDERLLLAKKYRDENVKKGRVNTQVYGLSSIDYNGIKDKDGNYINTPASEEVKKEYDKIQQYRKEGGYIYQQGGKKAETPFEKYLKKYPDTSSPQDTIVPQGVMLDADIRFKKGQRESLNKAFDATYFGYDKDFERFEDDKAKPVRKPFKKMQEGGQMQQQDSIQEQILMMLQQGATPEQVLQQLISAGIPQEEAIQAIQMVMQSAQQGAQPMPQEEQPMMQEGGMFNQPEVPEQMANAEIEDGEYVKDRQGIKYAEGEKHSNGGIPTQLENGAQVLSDFKKVGKELAKQLTEELGVKIRPTDTFASVLDKYDIKSGYKETQEEVEAKVKKIGDQEKKVKHDATLALNKQVLSEEIEEEMKELSEMEGTRQQVFDLLFQSQEATKAQETQQGNFMRDGGTIRDLMTKYNISEEDAKTLIPNYQGIFPSEYQQPTSIVPFDPNVVGNVGSERNRFEPKDFGKQREVGTNYYGDVVTFNSMDVQKQIAKLHPELYKKYFSEGQIKPSDVRNFQKDINLKYSTQLNNAKKLFGENSPQYNQLLSEVEKNKFLDDDSVRGLDNKFGDFTSTRPNFRLPVLPTEVFMQMQRAGITNSSQMQEQFPEEYEKYIKSKGLEGDFILGLQENQEVAPATTESALVAETPEQGVVAEEEKKRRLNMMLLPDQTPMQPWGMLPPAMTTQTIYAPKYNEIDPQEQLMEIQRNKLNTLQGIQNLPDSQQAASALALDANTNMATNKVMTETDRYNAMARERTEGAEAMQKTQQSQANIVGLQQYQQLLGQELEANEADWRNFYNRLSANNMNNWMTINEYNRANAFNPNVNFDGTGYVVQNAVPKTLDASSLNLNFNDQKNKKKK
jgi:hypothetical protein